MYGDIKANATLVKNKKGGMSMGKYTAAMKSVNPWDQEEPEDKHVDSEFWSYISDPATNKAFRDLWSIRYAKKVNVKFGHEGSRKAVETNY